MANSDIIKIGFDYRASLAQFEKETNGVFDGISNKAGKQKITIQLDAKDDKVIDKIKELQKLKLDKFTFEFGNSGLKEQLQTFDKLENKINEIISLSKGIDLSFNTKNKTDAYNQLKKYADAFKDYYGNEEAMATNAGAKAGYAYYKAYEEALRKGVAQSKLEKVTIDFDVNDSFFSKERIVGNRIKEFENFQKYGNADENNLIAEITSLENRLLKFNSAYSQVKANLGDAPITPEITKNIEEYVRLLEVAESRAKDAELFGYSSEDINSDKDLANMYLDFAKEDATAENKKYIESLKQEETQAIATAEAEQKLAEAQKETVSNTSNSNNSQIEELKSDIQEVKTELGDVKDRISSIESNGFENVRDDVEKTKESVKELNSELTEMKSNLSSTSQESNISSASTPAIERQIKSESELNAEIEKRENIIRELQQLQEKLTVHEDFHGNDRYFADQLPTEEEIREADKRIKQLTGTNDIFDVDKLIQDRNEWLSEVKYSLEEYDDLIKANDQKALDEYTTRGLSRIGGAESFFGYEDNNFSIASKFVEEKEKIQNEINDLYVDLDKLDEKMNLDSNNSSVDNTVQTQEKLQSELKGTQEQAEKTAQAVKEVASATASTEQKKDAFPKTSENLEQVAQSEQKVQQEAVATDKALDNISFTPNTEGFEDIIAKFGILREQAEKITKIVKTTKQTADGADISYKATLKNGSSYYLGENSTPQVLNANETIYDAKADNAKKLEREKQIWNELTTSLERYATIQKRIASNNALSTDNEEAIKLLEHIHELQRNDILPTEKLTVSNEKLQQINQTVTDLKAKLKESTLDSLQGSIDKYQKIYDQRKTYSSDFTPSEQYTKNLTELNTAIKNLVEYRNTLKNVSEVTTEQETHLKGLVTACEKASDSFKSLSASEKGASQIAVDKLVQRINKDLDECTNYSKEAKLGLRALRDELESANPRNLKEITSEIINIENAEIRAGRAGRSFFDTLKNSGFHQIAAQMAGMVGVYDVINVVKEGINTVRELDTAMTEVRKVSDATEAQYASFRDTVSSTAKEIASTNKELLNSSADFLRLGYSLEQAEDLAKNATLFVNVGDGVDITEATEDMITAMKAFDIQAEDSIKIVDDYNQIGNKYALSATDIGEAMKRSASALEVGNNSFEESIGLITAMNEIVQNSENTGNSLKVLSLRLRGAKAELEDMGEDTDGLCDSTSKLREQVKALSGVDIMEDDNTFKSTAQQVKELGEAFVKLDDVSQAALLEIIAGKSRSNAVAALLKNYQQIDNVIADLDDAEGSALRENEAIVDSIDGRIKVLSATAEEFWQKFIDTDFVKNAVSLASDLLGLLTQIIDKFGTLPTIAAGIGAAFSFKNVGEWNYISKFHSNNIICFIV